MVPRSLCRLQRVGTNMTSSSTAIVPDHPLIVVPYLNLQLGNVGMPVPQQYWGHMQSMNGGAMNGGAATGGGGNTNHTICLI